MTIVVRPPSLTPVLQVGLAQAVLGYAITGLGACLVLLAADLGLTTDRLAWLPAAFGLGLLAMAPAGPFLLRRGPRPALVTGSLALAASSVLLALAASVPVAVTGALLLGIGGAAFVLVTPVMLAGEGAAVQLTRVTAASSTASVLAPAAIGVLAATGAVNGRLALLICVPPMLILAATARSPKPTAAPARLPEPAATSARSPGSTVAPGTAPGRPATGVIARRWFAVVLAVSVEFCFTIWAIARLAGTGLTDSRAALLGTAFPIGLALGRMVGPLLLHRIPVVPAGAALTAFGALTVVLSGQPAPVTAGLIAAGLGVATLYPVTLAALVATPRLGTTHAASLGALASGTAILAAPAILARLADMVELRLAFLVTLPLLAALLLLRRG